MPESELHVVTGAFGYSGRYIAWRLLKEGYRVRTLTNSKERSNPLHGQIEAHSYHFDNLALMTESLRGAKVLYNTYWVRFSHGDFSHASAVRNTLMLIEAAKRAGVTRIVDVSITNPSEDSPLEYFRGKAQLERALIESGLPHAILRPAVLFGKEDILINNIAWLLRRFPIFTVFGKGDYRLQPIFVDDMAALAVQQGRERENSVIDAIGPEIFNYCELVHELGAIIGRRRFIVSIPPTLGYCAAGLIGWWMRDVLLTRDEIDGLMRGLLCTASPPAGKTKLTDWARQNAESLGRAYSSELARRRNRTAAY
jgi:NADH dehydrogenase